MIKLNIFAVLTLFASIISLTLGATICFLKKKTSLNRLFALVFLVNAYWAFGEFMLGQASTLGMAIFWSKVISFYPFFIALLFQCILIFTESNLLKSKWTYVVLYLPPLVFSIINLTTNLIETTPVLESWGYTSTLQSNSLLAIIFVIWAATLILSSVSWCTAYYYRLTETNRKLDS